MSEQWAEKAGKFGTHLAIFKAMQAAAVKLILVSIIAILTGAGSLAAAQKRPIVVPLVFSADSKNELIPQEFVGKLYVPSKTKGLIVYVHGGGCRDTPGAFDGDATKLTWIAKELYKRQYSVLMLNYQQDTNPYYADGDEVPGIYSQILCDEAINIHLERLRSTVAHLLAFETDGTVFRQPIYLLGHSYGGYLIDLLATDATLKDKVNKFISFEGVWDPSLDPSDPAEPDTAISHDMSPLDRDPHELGSTIVIQAKDDQVVSYENLMAFEKWAANAPEIKYQIIILEKGNHTPGEPGIVKNLAKKIDAALNN